MALGLNYVIGNRGLLLGSSGSSDFTLKRFVGSIEAPADLTAHVTQEHLLGGTINNVRVQGTLYPPLTFQGVIRTGGVDGDLFVARRQLLKGRVTATPTLSGELDVQSAGPGDDADALAIIAAMNVTPDATRQQLIHDTVVALKAAGAWGALDLLYITAAHDEQAARINWKSPNSNTLSAVGSLTFAEDVGFTKSASGEYLDAPFDPITAVNFKQNDASLGGWVDHPTWTTAEFVGIAEVRRTGGGFAYVRVRDNPSDVQATLNDGNASTYATTLVDGMYAASRLNSTKKLYAPGYTLIGTDSVASTGVPEGTTSFRLMGDILGASSFTNKMGFLGKASVMDTSAFHNAISNYLAGL